jgi:hypothetical protein
MLREAASASLLGDPGDARRACVGEGRGGTSLYIEERLYIGGRVLEILKILFWCCSLLLTKYK